VHRAEVRKQRGQSALDGARGELGHVGAQAIGFCQHTATLAEPGPARGTTDIEAENRR
jgi:hypothetical protein